MCGGEGSLFRRFFLFLSFLGGLSISREKCFNLAVVQSCASALYAWVRCRSPKIMNSYNEPTWAPKSQCVQYACVSSLANISVPHTVLC